MHGMIDGAIQPEYNEAPCSSGLLANSRDRSSCQCQTSASRQQILCDDILDCFIVLCIIAIVIEGLC